MKNSEVWICGRAEIHKREGGGSMVVVMLVLSVLIDVTMVCSTCRSSNCRSSRDGSA